MTDSTSSKSVLVSGLVATLLLVAESAMSQFGSEHASRSEAKGGPSAPSVESLVARAMERSPTLAALKSRLLAARDRVSPAGAPPDPMIEVMYRSEGRPWSPMRGPSMGEVAFTQVIPFPGKLSSRSAAASGEVEVREFEAREWKQVLIAEVRALYGEIYAVDMELEILESAKDVLELLAASAAASYAAGKANQESLVKAQLERSRLSGRIYDVRARRDSLRAELNRLLDEPADAPLGKITALPEVELPDRHLLDLALANCRIIRVAKAKVGAVELKLHSARLETRPNFLLGFGAGSTLSPEPVFTVRLGLELPFWKSEKQVPEIEAASNELEAARAELREAEATVRSRIASLSASWNADRGQITLYREGILPQAELMLAAARSAYETGTGDFSMVVEDFRLWLEAKVELARRESDRFVTWARIQDLISPLPPLENEEVE